MCHWLRQPYPFPADAVCGRCGGNHAGRLVKPLSRPTVYSNEIGTHFLMCPATDEPTIACVPRGCARLEAFAQTAATHPPAASTGAA